MNSPHVHTLLACCALPLLAACGGIASATDDHDHPHEHADLPPDATPPSTQAPVHLPEEPSPSDASADGGDASVVEEGPDVLGRELSTQWFDVATGALVKTHTGSLPGARIDVARGQLAAVGLHIVMQTPGTYDLAIKPASGTQLDGWDFSRPTNAASKTSEGSQSWNVNVGLVPVTARDGGWLEVHIKKRGATREWVRIFEVVLAP